MPEPSSSGRLTNRALIRLAPLDSDEDVAGFLQGLLTNDVTGNLPVYAGLLSAQGKTLFDLLVWPDEDGAMLLDCEAAVADALMRRLSMYRLRRRIAIGIDAQKGVYWKPGDSTDGVPDPRLVALGRRWLAAIRQDIPAVDHAWLAHRLSHGVSEGQAELADVLWLETNAAELNGVSFAKGCYVGQENTARMNWRQKVNRRLVVMPLAQSDPARQRAAYPELGVAVDLRRVADLEAQGLPGWLEAALSAG